MRILLTGSRGYIGTVMAPFLLDAGQEVVGVDTDLYRRSTFGPWRESIRTLRKDVREIQVADLHGFDAVIHLAALSNDPLGDLNPALTYEINHLATVRVERDVSRLADDSFSPTFLRCATAYGVSPRLRFDIVLNNLVAWAFTSGKVLLKSDGTPWRPIAHIEDISRAFLAVLAAPPEAVRAEAFNVGRDDQNYRIREIAQIVKETVPGCEIAFAEGAGPDKRNYRADFSKIGRLLPAFQPKWDARKGARQLYEAYKAIGLRLEDFEGPRYRRIDQLKGLIASGDLGMDLRWRTKVQAA